MLAYIIRRVLLSLFTIWVISILAFVIIELPPGDQVDRFKEITESRIEIPDPEKIALLRSYLGLDQPQYIRYLKWMANLAQATWGCPSSTARKSTCRSSSSWGTGYGLRWC